MRTIAETCVRFDAAHLSINLVSEIVVPMFTTLLRYQIPFIVWIPLTSGPRRLKVWDSLLSLDPKYGSNYSHVTSCLELTMNFAEKTKQC